MRNALAQSPFKTEAVCKQAAFDIFGSSGSFCPCSITRAAMMQKKAAANPYKGRLRDVTKLAENPSQVQMVER